MAIDFRDYIKNTQALTEGIELINKLIEGVEKGAKATKKDGGLINERQTKEVKAWNAAIKEMDANYKGLLTTLGAYLKTTKEVENAQKNKNKRTIEEIEHLKQLKQAERLNAKVRLTQAGTIENIRARLALVTHEWARLTKVEGINTVETKKLAAEKLRLSNVLKQVESATGDNRRNVGNYASAWGRLKNSIVSVSQAAGVFFGIMGAVRLFKNYVSIIRDFEKTNATLAGVLQKSKEEMSGLTDEAVRLSRITVKTADEVAQLQVSYARLGFVQEEIIALTEATIQGSIALNAELDQTALLTGAMVKTFNEFDVTDAAEILDVMALATAKSALNFEKLQKALPIVGGAANAAGLSFTRTTALLAKLADSGIDVSTSATAIRNILIRSSKAGLTYNQMLELVAASSDKLSAAANKMGVRAAVSGTILAANLDGIKEMDLALNDAGETVNDMAEKELATLDGAIKLVNSAWEGYIIDSARANDVNVTMRKGLTFLAKNLGKIIDIIFKAGTAWLYYFGFMKLKLWYNQLLIANEARLALAMTNSAAASIADASAKGTQAAATTGLVNAQGVAIASTTTLGKATGVMTGFVNMATTAWGRLMATLKANIFGIVAAGVYLLITALQDAEDEMDEFERQNFFREYRSWAVTENAREAKTALVEMADAIRKTKNGTKEREEALKAFNQEYNTTLQNEEDELDFLVLLSKTQNKLNKEIEDNSMVKTMTEEIRIMEDQLVNLGAIIDQGPPNGVWSMLTGGQGRYEDNVKQYEEISAALLKTKQDLSDFKELMANGRDFEIPELVIPTEEFDPELEKKKAKLRQKIKDDVAKMYREGTQADLDSKKQELKRDKDFITDKEYYERAKKLLKEQYEFDKSLDTLSDADKKLLEETYITDAYALHDDYTDKIIKLRDKDAKDAEKKRQADLKAEKEAQKQKREDFDRSMKYILDGIQQIADQRVIASERAVQQEQLNVELQNQRAVAGLSNTLAQQQRLLAKAEQERAIATKKAAQVEKARSLYTAYSGYAKSDSNTALAKTLKDYAILEAITAIASFGSGGIIDENSNVKKSGLLKGPSHNSRKGGIPILAEGDEGILSVKAMRNLGRDNFHEIANLAEKGKVDDQIFTRQLKQHNTIMVETGLKEEMVRTRKAIESKRELSAPELVRGMIQITETTRKGNYKTRNNYRIRKPRL